MTVNKHVLGVSLKTNNNLWGMLLGGWVLVWSFLYLVV